MAKQATDLDFSIDNMLQTFSAAKKLIDDIKAMVDAHNTEAATATTADATVDSCRSLRRDLCFSNRMSHLSWSEVPSLTSISVKKSRKIDVAFDLAMLRSCMISGMVAPGFLGIHGGVFVDQSDASLRLI
jgi:hypothetical protein